MAISWSGEGGQSRVKVGIDIEATPNSDGTAIYLKAHFYAQAALNISDNVYLHITGVGGTFNTGTFKMANTGLYHVHTIDHGWQYTAYNHRPTYSWGVSLGDYYSSPSPSHTVSWTQPARPSSVPGYPGLGVDSITSSSARIVVTAAPDNGSTITAYQVVVGTSGNTVENVLNSQVANFAGGTGTATGLSRATPYAYIARAANGHGWGPWAGLGYFTTLATVPDAPTSLAVSDVQPETAKLTWTTPANGGNAISGYTVQVCTSSSFSTSGGGELHTFTTGDLSGLSAGTAYHVRVRANNGVGAGAWSAVKKFETLSGAKVKVAGAWRTGKAHVKVAGTWRVAKAWKKVNGAWVI